MVKLFKISPRAVALSLDFAGRGPQTYDGEKAGNAVFLRSTFAAATWPTASSSGRRRLGVPSGKALSRREGKLGESITNCPKSSTRRLRRPKPCPIHPPCTILPTALPPSRPPPPPWRNFRPRPGHPP